MNPANSDPVAYMTAVILLYTELPETPLSASIQDQRLARHLHERGISLQLVEAAMLLASLRRLVRPADFPPLPPIRSLAYFHPVIEELLVHPVPDNYLEYLRLKLTRSPKTRRLGRKSRKSRFQMIANIRVRSPARQTEN
jgi:hypothetical protein